MPEGYTAIHLRLRHWLGNCWRLMNLPWRQRSVQLEEVSTIFGCSFGSNGWQHLVETLKEYERNPEISWRKSTLYQFHSGFCPTNIFELVGDHVCQVPLFVYPWGSFNVGVTQKKDVWSSRFCGPSSEEFVAAEYGRLIALHHKVKELGYRPWRYGNGFISGTFLRSLDGRRRFVVMQGNHRMAVLANMGARRVSVRTGPGHILGEVWEKNVHRWPLVKDGRCSPQLAHAVFRMFFEENGEHVRRLITG